MVEKVIRDGKVAILVSPDFGAGWSTWADPEYKDFTLFDQRLVAAVEAKASVAEIKAIVDEALGPDNSMYMGGARTLEVQWLPVGTPFYVHEYDGSESIKTSADFDTVA